MIIFDVLSYGRRCRPFTAAADPRAGVGHNMLYAELSLPHGMAILLGCDLPSMAAGKEAAEAQMTHPEQPLLVPLASDDGGAERARRCRQEDANVGFRASNLDMVASGAVST